MLITRRRFLVASAASMTLWSLGCSPSGRASVPAPISPPKRRDNMRVDQWQTWCVGRNLIDLPIGATVIDTNNEGRFISGFETEIDGHLFRRLPGVNAEKAKVMAEQRARELKGKRHETEGSWLIGTYSLTNGALVIRHWGATSYTGLNTAEVYFVAQNSKDLVCTYSEDFQPQNWDKALRWFTQLGNALYALEPGEIPKVPGFCGDGFIIKDTRSGRGEFAEIRVRLPMFPAGLLFAFTAATSTPSRKGLADNPDVLEEGCYQLGGRDELVKCDTLRNGRHKVGPIDAYEICVAGKVTTSPVRLYRFYWQTPGEPFSYAVPIMEAALHYITGSMYIEHQDPSTAPGCFYTDREALDLWDDIVNSIRIRPGAVDPNYTKLIEE